MDYTGQGGTLNFNTVLGGDDSATDRLVVAGDTAGDTAVRVTNAGGSGAQTAEGIKLIDVQGASNGNFTLKGDYVFQGDQAVVAGAYAYRLYKDGLGDHAGDGDWYLRSALTSGGGEQNPPPSDGTDPKPVDPPSLYQPGVPVYEAYAGVLQQINTADTLIQRTGDRVWSGGQVQDELQPGEGLWARVDGGDRTMRPDTSTSGADYDISAQATQVGIDATVSEGDGGKWVAGGSLKYGRYQSNVSSVFGQGRIKTDAYSLGGALTWYGNNGFYVDGQARVTRFSSDLRSSTLDSWLKDGNQGTGYLASVEVGRQFRLNEHWTLVPQAQLSYGDARFDGFSDIFGARVSQRDGSALTSRAGLMIDYKEHHQGKAGAMTTHVYAVANLYANTGDSARVNVAGTDFTTRNQKLWSGFGVGGSLDWAKGRYSVYGEVQAQKSIDSGNSHALNGSVGFRMRW